jgi:lysophospholipase L1-like esterase
MPASAGTTGSMAGTTPAVAGTSGAHGTAGMLSPATGGVGGVGVDTGGMGGAGGQGAGGTAGTVPGPPMPCIDSGSDLLVIGDSYIDYINPLVPPLEAKASADGQLPSGSGYNNNAVAGAFIADIERQWQTNKRANPKFVLMDGGGNDVLLGAPQCLIAGSNQDPTCMGVVQSATEVGRRIVQDVKASGVKGSIYFFYPHIPAGGWDILDYALPLARQVCEEANDATFKCVFIDTRALFEGHVDYFFVDGIHPSVTGSDALADLIWTTMKQNCIAQASGCCM